MSPAGDRWRRKATADSAEVSSGHSTGGINKTGKGQTSGSESMDRLDDGGDDRS